MLSIKHSLALCAVAALSLPVAAIPIAASGTYSGVINGTPILANATGAINTDGGGGGLSINFGSIDNGTFSPLALASSFNTFICWGSAQRLDAGARNLFDLSGGNYAIARTYSWPGLPGSDLTASGNVAFNGATLSYSAVMNGTYNGPLDIVGVQDYIVHWIQGAGNDVNEVGSATLLTSGGGSFLLNITSTYSGLSQPLLHEQVGHYFPNAVYTPTGPGTGTMVTEWAATMASVNAIPEPPSLALMLLALALLPRAARSRLTKRA